MFDYSTDQNGVWLAQRAAKFRADQEAQARKADPFYDLHKQIGGSNPTPDRDWDGFFQALREAHVGRLADNSVAVKRGMVSENPLDADLNPDGSTDYAVGDRRFDPAHPDPFTTVNPIYDKEGNLNGYRSTPAPDNNLAASRGSQIQGVMRQKQLTPAPINGGLGVGGSFMPPRQALPATQAGFRTPALAGLQNALNPGRRY